MHIQQNSYGICNTLSGTVAIASLSCIYRTVRFTHTARHERERITTHPIRKVDLGPDLQPRGSRPGDKTCMQRCGRAVYACGYGRWRLVASAAGKTSLHRRGTHAGITHKHGDNGKQSVYAVQLSASPSYIYIIGNE